MSINDTVAVKLVVRDTLLDLVEANRAFKLAVLKDAILPAWIMNGVDHLYDREKAAEISALLTYKEEQNRQETTKCTGIIGISTSTLQAGIDLNQKKDAFKKAMSEYRALFGHSFSMTGLSSKEIRETLLGNLKLQHLHFVQSYRHIKLFSTPPKRVGFSWAASHTGAVRLTTVKAIDHLRSKFTQSKGLLADIQILEGLPEHTEIVIKRPLTSHLRANLTWPEEIEAILKQENTLKLQHPAQINTPLPLFICMKNSDDMPDFNKIRPLDKEAKQERLQRRDARLRKLSSRSGSVIYIPET